MFYGWTKHFGTRFMLLTWRYVFNFLRVDTAIVDLLKLTNSFNSISFYASLEVSKIINI